MSLLHTNARMIRGRTGLRVAAVAAILALLSGCAGHGKYTQAHKDASQKKVGNMKSAAQWDAARQSYLVGDLDKALASVDQSIANNAEVPKSHILRGRILLEMGQYDQAMASLAKGIELDPDNAAGQNVQGQYYTGVCHEQLGQKQDALDCYLKANELDPASPQYAVAAAELMIDLGRAGGAEAFLLSRSASYANDAGVKQTLGHIAMLKGETDNACVLFNEARLLAPDDLCLLEDLARAQLAAGRYAEAEYNFGKLLENKDNKDRRDLLHLRARCLVEVDRPVDARGVLVKLTEGDSGAKDVEAWIELGHVSYILGDLNRVKQSASRAIGIAPSRFEGYLLRALALRQEGDLVGAMAALNIAVDKSGNDTTPLVLRGLIAQQIGQYGIATASFQSALAQDPSDSKVRELLTEASSRSGNSAVAGVPEDAGR